MNVQWRKVTPLSKTIALVLFVALPFIGFWLGIQYGEVIGSPNTTITLPISTSSIGYYQNVAAWQTTTDSSARFSMAYPLDFNGQDNYSATPSANWRLNADNTPGTLAFTLTIPPAFEPQTNFSDATLTVGESADTQAITDCLAPDASGGPAMATSTVMINGTQFTVFNSSDAGAGNFYQTTSYRTLHAGKCYAVEYTIHSGQIANYPASYGLQPLNEGMLTDVLNRIVNTFTLL